MTRHVYLYRKIPGITFKARRSELFLDIRYVKEAIAKFNETIDKINSFEVNIFEILGMRNLSAFIGEVFAASLIKVSNGLFVKNPHQDGYPDLLAMTKDGRAAWGKLKNNLRDKKPFSPFLTGGIEIKATCGSVPTPAVFARRGLSKPDIGDTRIEYVVGYDWKAHHRETSNLIGIFWDFMDGKPTIAAVFYSDSNLTESDWGEIIKPRSGGGRTTSVSIMTRGGVRKMYEGWVAVIKDKRYTEFFNRYNRGNLIGGV
jgi:hypothetical protein